MMMVHHFIKFYNGFTFFFLFFFLQRFPFVFPVQLILVNSTQFYMMKIET